MGRMLVQYRETLEFENEEEYKWALDRLNYMRKNKEWGFDWEGHRPKPDSPFNITVYTHAAELKGISGPLKVAHFVQEYLGKFEKDFVFTMQWAVFPEPFSDGGHGGGVFLVSRDDIYENNTNGLVAEMQAKFKEGTLT